MTPAAEKLRLVLKEIYSPIQRAESFDTATIEMQPPLHSARSAARELNLPLSQILRAIARGIVVPQCTASRQVIIDQAQLETLRLHLKSKP